MKFRVKELKTLTFVITIWGIVMLSSGYSMQTHKNLEIKKLYTVNITSKQTTQVLEKKTELILKKIEIEVGTPISTNSKDYIENVQQFSELQLKQLTETLDTSLVNINQPGTYKYFINYKKKKYEGTIKVNEKEIPNVTFTLKAKIMPTTGTISRNKKDYIYEQLDEEIYNNMILDLREVEAHQSIPGKYKYTITFKDTVYYGDYEIVEDVITNRVTVTCPADATLDNNKKICICMDDDKEFDEETKSCVLKEAPEPNPEIVLPVE